jgi:6-phospho-beta-glucosidase
VKLAILGGGGFRVPLVYGAVLRDLSSSRVDVVTLYDVAPGRLEAIGHVIRQMAHAQATKGRPAKGLAAKGPGIAPAVETTTDLDQALDGADFVFSAIRVGGLEGRTTDERVALDLGILGQETTGPGGLAYGMRTVPVAIHIAERIARVCPQAWVINFTNPAGMITEAMQQVLGERVVGICDTPAGLGRRAAQALGHDLDLTSVDYVGLNHLGWLRALRHEGRDVLPDLIGDAQLLTTIEEGRLFGPEWIQMLGCLPNEYLYYYYFTRDAVASIRGDAQTRGEFLLDQQRAFYEAVGTHPAAALHEWRRVREQRDATYMRESRAEHETRDVADILGGGYEGVALSIMGAIVRNERSTLILNVRNGSAVPGLPPEAVVEVPCTVDGDGPQPLATLPLAGHQLGLVQQVKAVEQLTIQAARSRSAPLALKAFALHPLVDSVNTAKVLLQGYRDRHPDLGALLG